MTATVGGATWSYFYDPFGRRYAKTSPTGAVTLYLHDRDDTEVGEYDGVTGLTLRENRYDPRRVAPVAMLSYANGAGNGATPVLTFNHVDRLGSVVATSSAPDSSSNAVLTGQYKYDAWGQSTTLIGTGFGYAGYRYDAETGLYQTGARYYDTRLGRFLSTDPLGQGPGLNVYAYVGNDPLNNVDPDGLAKVQIFYRPTPQTADIASHSYVVVSESNGSNPMVFRAGPGDTGTIYAQSAPYGPGSIDYISSPRAITVLINDNLPTSYYENQLQNFQAAVNAAAIPYSPISTNSNAYAAQAIEALGVSRPQAPTFAPAYGTVLPLTANPATGLTPSTGPGLSNPGFSSTDVSQSSTSASAQSGSSSGPNK